MHLRNEILELKNLSQFFNPVEINFGRSCREKLLADLGGKKYTLISSKRGRNFILKDPILSRLINSNLHYWVDDVIENPDIQYIEQIVKNIPNGSDLVLAVGGGSVIDVAKTISVLPYLMGSNGGYSWEKNNIENSALPVVVLPTTAGSGSEVTPFAALWDRFRGRKNSISGRGLFPQAAYIDSELMEGAPIGVKLSCGLDAINQASESIWNRNATPTTIMLATSALKYGFRALPELINGDSTDSRNSDMMAMASLLAGMAISQTKTALCHSISYPLTISFGIPHGLACAFTMVSVLEVNIPFARERFQSLAKELLGNSGTIEGLIDLYKSLVLQLNVKSSVLEYVGNTSNLLDQINNMHTLGRADNNLAPVNYELIKKIIYSSINK